MNLYDYFNEKHQEKIVKLIKDNFIRLELDTQETFDSKILAIGNHHNKIKEAYDIIVCDLRHKYIDKDQEWAKLEPKSQTILMRTAEIHR